jgi:hypothetical protein
MISPFSRLSVSLAKPLRQIGQSDDEDGKGNDLFYGGPRKEKATHEDGKQSPHDNPDEEYVKPCHLSTSVICGLCS